MKVTAKAKQDLEQKSCPKYPYMAIQNDKATGGPGTIFMVHGANSYGNLEVTILYVPPKYNGSGKVGYHSVNWISPSQVDPYYGEVTIKSEPE